MSDPKADSISINRTDREPLPDDLPASMALGGSPNDAANLKIVNDAMRSFWNTDGDNAAEWLNMSRELAANALFSLAPRNEHEGMLAAQLVASYAATMECFRRAAINDQYPQSRKDNLNLANKSARTFATLTDALQKLRGEAGRQSVHVHHHHHDSRTQVAAHKATVNVGTPEGGGEAKNDGQPHEPTRSLAYTATAPTDFGAPMRRKEPAREPVPRPCDEG